MTEDEMIGQHHLLNGHEFEQAAGVGNGQGNLVGVLQSMGHKDLDTTEQLNNVGANGEVGSIPWSGRSPGGGHGNPLQYSKVLHKGLIYILLRYRCCSAAQSCQTLCEPMDCSMPGFTVLHHLQELSQVHIHGVGDAIQPSHPLSFPSPPAFNLSQDHGFFQLVNSLHQVAKVLELQLQLRSFQ